MVGNEREERDEIYSKSVRAGKRTYFFDVKATRNNDYYLTITESKKVFEENGNGQAAFEKHKVFLYKEDFDKFSDGLEDTIKYIKNLLASSGNPIPEEKAKSDYDKVDFDSI